MRGEALQEGDLVINEAWHVLNGEDRARDQTSDGLGTLSRGYIVVTGCGHEHNAWIDASATYWTGSRSRPSLSDTAMKPEVQAR